MKSVLVYCRYVKDMRSLRIFILSKSFVFNNKVFPLLINPVYTQKYIIFKI